MCVIIDDQPDSRANERERQAIMTERDRQNSSLRTYEGDLHSMERKENTLSNQIRDKDVMEERIVVMTNDISALSARLKVFILSAIRYLSCAQRSDSLGIGREACRGSSSYSTSRTGAPTGPGRVEREDD
jgi:hypothetical protein